MRSLLTKIKAKSLSVSEMQTVAGGGDCEDLYMDTGHMSCWWDAASQSTICDMYYERDWVGEECH